MHIKADIQRHIYIIILTRPPNSNTGGHWISRIAATVAVYSNLMQKS